MVVMERGDVKSYSDRAIEYHNSIKEATGLVIDTLDKISPRPGHPFVIGDYGTADGGTSYELIRKCIEFLRNKYGKGLPIQMIYEDQPMNDFKPVFLRANGTISSQTDAEKLVDFFRTFTEKSFYLGLASHRSEEQKLEILDMFYQRFVNTVMENRDG